MAGETPTISEDDAADRFFRVVSSSDAKEPIVQYLRFSENGWLLEIIKLFISGRVVIEVASKDWPLSVDPMDLDDFVEEWDGGSTEECSRDEYLAMSALVKRADSASTQPY